jgi:hypothetical protein
MLSYKRQWQEYRKRNLIFLIVSLSYIPGVALIGVPLSRLLKSENIIGVVAIMWMIAFAVIGMYRNLWKCPRCRKPFFLKGWYHNTFAGRCVNCGLPKWGEADAPKSL